MSRKDYSNRIGEQNISNEGFSMRVKSYISSANIDIEFEDGTITCSKNYCRFKEGSIKKPVNYTGEKHITNEGFEVEIIKHINSHNCTVKFSNGLVLENRTYNEIKDGRLKNLNHPSVYGVGYIGKGEYKSEVRKKAVKEYYIWSGMLERCYNKKFQEKQPTYKGCSVAEEWLDFQNFAKWFDENYIEGFHLDKDILIKGNKIYSPETCCFVPREINTLFTFNNINRGELPLGVGYTKNKKKYVSQLSKGVLSKHLGTFSTPEEAFQAYKIAKESYIKEVADKWKDLISEQVYEAMYNYKVEITD